MIQSTLPAWLQLFTMKPFLYLDESMQHTSHDVGVADIDYHGNGQQVAQNRTQQVDCDLVIDEDRPVSEDLDESENEEYDDDIDKECYEEVSRVRCSLSLYIP